MSFPGFAATAAISATEEITGVGGERRGLSIWFWTGILGYKKISKALKTIFQNLSQIVSKYDNISVYCIIYVLNHVNHEEFCYSEIFIMGNPNILYIIYINNSLMILNSDFAVSWHKIKISSGLKWWRNYPLKY